MLWITTSHWHLVTPHKRQRLQLGAHVHQSLQAFQTNIALLRDTTLRNRTS